MQQSNVKNKLYDLYTGYESSSVLAVKQSGQYKYKMSIPRFSAMISTRKWQKQSFDENKEPVKTIQAETFGQITN
jgi:hypothetical protein